VEKLDSKTAALNHLSFYRGRWGGKGGESLSILAGEDRGGRKGKKRQLLK